MSPDDFWLLIDDTRPEGANPDQHASALTGRLVELGPEACAEFVQRFDETMDALFRWDLWGAAYLAFAGCSDDAFEYLRAWLIGQGRDMCEQAQADPERLFTALLAGSDDPDLRWSEIGINEGEPLLYAGGSAFEELTGDRPRRVSDRPTEPSGVEWDEDDLPHELPELMAALPAQWWETEESDAPPARDDPVLDAVIDGLRSAGEGDHRSATRVLGPLLDDFWDHLGSLGLATDVAYAVGIGRLLDGDASGAKSALEKIESPPDHVRRALAQVDLAAGELANAARLLDSSADAHLFDRALSAVLAQRTGRRDDAVALADSVFESASSGLHVPWDAAGAALQVGFVLVELEDAAGAARALDLVTDLTRDAPAALPLVGQQAILAAGSLRLHNRPKEALGTLDRVLDRLSDADVGQALRETARSRRDLGDAAIAHREFERAIDAYLAAGEAWQAADARRELAAWPGHE